MEILAHELLQLYWYGVDVTLPESVSEYHGSTINVKAMLLQWIGDYRGQPKAFCQTQSPAHRNACYQCAIQGLRAMGKTIYPAAWKACSLGLREQTRRKNGVLINNPNKDPHESSSML